MRELTVSRNDSGQRLDKFLSKRFPTLPEGLLRKYLRLKCVKINGKRQTAGNVVLAEGDVLSLYIKDEFFGGAEAEKAAQSAYLSVKPDFGVVYEDENIIICDKPVGLICQSDASESYNTLVNHVKAYLHSRGEYDPEKENTFSPALCNRIDKNTQGLVIAAKNAEALRVMNEKIKNREIKKTYMCLVYGVMPKSSDTLRSWLRKDADDNHVMLSRTEKDGYKEIITSYTVLGTDGDISLLSVVLGTGRTHQIRAQMAEIGHPLMGDTKYGTLSQNKGCPFKYQALASVELEFVFRDGIKTALDYLNGKCFSTKAFFLPYKSFKQP